MEPTDKNLDKNYSQDTLKGRNASFFDFFSKLHVLPSLKHTYFWALTMPINIAVMILSRQMVHNASNLQNLGKTVKNPPFLLTS